MPHLGRFFLSRGHGVGREPTGGGSNRRKKADSSMPVCVSKFCTVGGSQFLPIHQQQFIEIT